MPKQRYDRNSVVQGKGDQSAHILLTSECGEKRTAETSWIAFAADRTAECFSKRHLHDSYHENTMYASGAEPEKAEPTFAQKMIVRKDGIEVEMPADISERLLLTLLRGLKEC